MRVFDREIAGSCGQVLGLFRYAWYFLRCLLLLKQPWEFIRSYLRQVPPADRTVEFRSGLRILLSDHPHDIITVFVVFVRRDYGKVHPGSIVLDVGANIGVFALYAAQCGATKVLAVEPNSSCYQALLRNISVNRLMHVVTPLQRAVYPTDGEVVRFPRAPSMYNSIIRDDDAKDAETVQTISLASLVREAAGTDGSVDLLKLDCEGAEYDALFSTSRDTTDRIQTVRMEYHQGNVQGLTGFFERRLFRTVRHRPAGDMLGSLWLQRENAYGQVGGQGSVERVS